MNPATLRRGWVRLSRAGDVEPDGSFPSTFFSGSNVYLSVGDYNLANDKAPIVVAFLVCTSHVVGNGYM